MNGGALSNCPDCRRLVIYGQTCVCGTVTSGTSSLLSGPDRTTIYGAINFRDDDIEATGWRVIEDVVRKYMARAWGEGYSYCFDHEADDVISLDDNPYAT